MIGQRIGQYEIVEEVGKGGMATVYRAFQPTMERFVAVKVIHRFVAEDQLNMQRFRQEARLISKLEHPHLLPIYEYNADYDPPYIVMRFLEGGSMKDVLQERGHLPFGEIAHLMRQVCSVLDYAHRQGVVHRDIKPANIMVDKEGNAFLTDFGIARSSEGGGMTATGFTMGTPGYMSPEQSMGESTLDNRADIYALGVVLYEMATGYPPFTAETPMKLIMRHMNDAPPSASGTNTLLPLMFDAVVHKALAKKPEDRYETAAQLYQELERIVGSTAANAKPIELTEAADKMVRRQQERRDEAQIQTLLNQFALKRGSVGDLTHLPNIQTVNTPTPMQVAQTAYKTAPTLEQQPSNRLPFIGLGIAMALVIGAIGFFALFNIPEFRAILQNATETALPSLTPTPSDTSIPTATYTPLPSNTPLPTDTATPATPVFVPRRSLPVLAGASSLYAQVATIEVGDELEIVGKSEDGRYYNILLPDGSTGWVIASGVSGILQGNNTALKVVVAPSITPSPTITPSITPSPTATHTPTVTPSFTPTDTVTPSPTATHTPTVTPSFTPTDTVTPSPTATDTATPSPTATDTATVTPSFTPTDTPTATLTATSAFTPTLVPSITPTAVVCGGALPSRLSVGTRGFVIVDSNTTSNRVREFAGTGFTLVGTIPSGGVFEIYEGPQCADGFAWWRVNYNGLIGWTPEGDPADYWLQDLPLAPNEDPIQEPILTIGKQAVVYTEDEGLNFRALPSSESVIIGFVPPGSIVTLVEGPRESGGYIWWKIQDFTFREGWARSFADGIVTLIPLEEESNVIPKNPCRLTTLIDASLFLQPHTRSNGDPVGDNTEYLAYATSLAEPGAKWYFIEDGKWVLADWVNESGDCDALPRIR